MSRRSYVHLYPKGVTATDETTETTVTDETMGGTFNESDVTGETKERADETGETGETKEREGETKERADETGETGETGETKEREGETKERADETGETKEREGKTKEKEVESTIPESLDTEASSRIVSSPIFTIMFDDFLDSLDSLRLSFTSPTGVSRWWELHHTTAKASPWAKSSALSTFAER